jgi:CelD/BcsL family acetyltransferase involved in cellulose biosynthesis
LENNSLNPVVMASTYDIDRRIDFTCESTQPIGRDTFRVDPLQDVRWRDFIATHPRASVFHRVEWLQALKTTYGYRPVIFTSTHPGLPLQNGIPLCEVRSLLTGNRLVSLPFSDHCEPLSSCADEANELFNNLIATVSSERWNYFELRPVAYSPSAETGLRPSTSYHFHRLDLRPEEQTLFKRFHKDSIQRKIVRAEREGLRCEHAPSEELLSAFYQLLLKTRRRHGIPPQPRQWFRNLITAFGPDLAIRVAFKNDTPVASILTIRHNKTLVYKYGCSDTRYSNLGGTPLLFWHAIQDARANGLEELDMGRSDWSNSGLVTFKDRWGAQRSTLTYWRYPSSTRSSRWQSLASHAKRLVTAAPDCVLVMLSNLAYRHIA